jgi:signal transduction histidine kinase
MDGLTFRARLTLATTSIVAVAVVLLGAVAFLTVRVALDTSLQNRLETTAFAIRSVVDVRHGKLQALDGEDREQLLSLLGQRTDGAVLWGDGRLMASDLASPPPAILAAIAKPGAVRGEVRVASENIAYVVLPVTEKGIRYGTVAAWESHDASDDAAHIALIALGVAGAIVVVLALLGGNVLTKRLMRPVTDLSSMLSEIEATDLTERLSWAGPDDELARLCRTFDRLLDRLERAFDRERRFIADASHELRTPVTVMRAEVELALMHERTPDEYREALARLQRETRRLETLAESLLLTARHDAGAIPPNPVALDRAARAAIERMRPLAIARAIALDDTIAITGNVLADAEMIESAIVALIDNALRFAPPGGTVSIDLAREGATIVLAVRDTGPGFSEQALQQATQRFWRDDPARSGAGSGLGLSIVRSIVERFHGSLGLSNAAAGSGAIVSLTLPELIAADT